MFSPVWAPASERNCFSKKGWVCTSEAGAVRIGKTTGSFAAVQNRIPNVELASFLAEKRQLTETRHLAKSPKLANLQKLAGELAILATHYENKTRERAKKLAGDLTRKFAENRRRFWPSITVSQLPV